MLIFSRKRNDALMIGDNIRITILDIIGDAVKVGIEAPRAIAVHREEIYRKIQEANIQAASATPTDLLDRMRGITPAPPSTPGPTEKEPTTSSGSTPPAASNGPTADTPVHPEPTEDRS